MNITDTTRALILNALRAKNINQSRIAEHMGYGKPWVSKLLNGTLKTLSDEDSDKLADLLGITFACVIDNRRVSGVTLRLNEAMEVNPQSSSAGLRRQRRSLRS